VYPALQRHSLCVLHPAHDAPEFAGHAAQLALPSGSLSSLYAPAEQFTHGPAHGPLVPAGQTTQHGPAHGPLVPAGQTTQHGPAHGPLVPAGQATQHGPSHGPLVPAGQATHTADAFENVCPGLHVHALASLQPTHDAPEFAGQATHAVAAVAVEYVAEAQAMHAAEPVAFLYVPATHAVQVVTFAPV